MVRVTDSLLPQIATDFGTTVGEASIVVAAYAVAHGSVQLVIGPVSDRFGKYRTVALMCAVATVLVARVSGPSGVGVFALLRVLPGLLGVLLAGGLPTAVAYFLARPSAPADGGRLRLTIVTVAGVAGIVGTVIWMGQLRP